MAQRGEPTQRGQGGSLVAHLGGVLQQSQVQILAKWTFKG
jgi:hypothetical protein